MERQLVVKQWRINIKTPLDRSKKIRVLEKVNPYLHTGKKDRIQRFALYSVFDTVGEFCDAIVALRQGGVLEAYHAELDDPGMGDLHWDLIQNWIVLE
jgi:hypothetical protein